MNKVIIELMNGNKIECIKDGNIIVYDAKNKGFYITTSESFFAKYDQKFQECIKRYDEQVADLESQIKDLQEQMNSFLEIYKSTNEKVIKMVENITKEGGK